MSASKLQAVFVLIFSILVLSCVISAITGPIRFQWSDVVSGLNGNSNYRSTILFSVRLPRIAAACLTGSALALAGLVFQALMRNPLASPYTLGLASGASVGAVFASLLGFRFAGATPLFAFAGSLLTIGIVLYVSKARASFESGTIILAGVLWSSLANAILSLLLSIISPNQLQTFFYWFLGSLAIAEWPSIIAVGPVVLLLAVLVFFLSWDMNALSVGEDLAAGVGIPVLRTRLLLYIGASLLTALVVSIAGTIGFIGLVVPHFTRLLLGADNRVLVPGVVLVGASVCVLADLLARTMIAPAELPVGVVTAFIGVPVFGYFLRRRKV